MVKYFAVMTMTLLVTVLVWRTMQMEFLDSGRDILLPQGEADLMTGKEVVIGEKLFVTYDNFRLRNSEICGRASDEYIEISVFPGYAASGSDDVLPQLYLLEPYNNLLGMER